MARLETLDQGQPLGVAKMVSLGMAADVFRYYAGWCTKIEGKTSAVSIPGTMHYTRREPVGVVRPDYAMELPSHDRCLETRARAAATPSS